MGRKKNSYRYGGVSLTLDDAFGGYSCYELFTAGWSKSVMWVRRSSDSATAYVFFDSNGTITVDSLISLTSQTTPDTPSVKLSTWASTDEIFVNELYMQFPDDSAIDSNYTLKQNNSLYQPTIMNGGTVNVDANGTTCLLGDAQSWLHQTSYTPFPHLADTEDWSIFDGARTISASQNMVTWSNISRAIGVDGNNSRVTGYITKVTLVSSVTDDTLTTHTNTQSNVPGGYAYYLTGHHHVAADKSLQSAYSNAYADSTKGGTLTYSTGYQNDGFCIMSQLFRNSELGNGDWYCNIHFAQVVPSASRTGIYNEIDAIHGTIFQ